MNKLLILFILIFIYITIKDKKEMKTNNNIDLKKVTYADEKLHYEEVIYDFLEHIEECDGD